MLSRSIAKNFIFRSSLQTKSVSRFCSSNLLEGYGDHLFKGAIAAQYLEKQGLPADALESAAWTTDGTADKIAGAVLEWAKDNNASVYCHWFQPLGASGVRHGMSGQVQNSMIKFNSNGKPEWDFKGKNLLKGETDGSSFPNGGLRATHRAGAYLAVDPTSPIFLRGDTIFIPSCVVSYYGHALDEKTPLLRASDALSREGTRLLNLLGYKVKSIQANIGLEQEFFFVPRSAYLRRPDLQFTGRTVLGRFPARGQEMSDHYYAPPSLTSPALACMQEVQNQCFKMGIPLRTRHREVAPNQYEFAPLYGTVTTQIDQNLMVMQILEEVSATYGLQALLQEKPFQGVNGSGKHNNWSLGTDDGTNLLNVGELAAKSGSTDIFPIVMAAMVKAVKEHGDLMRMAIACPGNDFRLGACEAPPAIMSMYLGDDMTNYLTSFMNGENKAYQPGVKHLDLGAKCLAKLEVPAEDRNRTSPFPFGGHRFEFRAVGSSQNVSLVNTVLACITANAFKEFSDAIEKGTPAKQVARDALKANFKVVFNGNGYDPVNQEMLTKEGAAWRIDSGVDAICRYTAPKNVQLFEGLGVLTAAECEARQNVMLNHYIGTVEMEALTMIDMLKQHIIPTMEGEASAYTKSTLMWLVKELKKEVHAIHAMEDLKTKAEMSRKLRLETMIKVRETADAYEGEASVNDLSLATYKELLFLDSHNE